MHFLRKKEREESKMSELSALLPHLKFHFNVKHPRLEECYTYGYACARADVGEEENPYRLHTREYEQWLEGWWAGFYGEEPLFNWEEYVESLDESPDFFAMNDDHYQDTRESYLTKVLEIAGVIAVSAILGYQVIDLVA